MKKTIADIKQQYNLTSDNVNENTAVLGMLGASSNESMNQLYPLAAACFVIIMISGVLMISSFKVETSLGIHHATGTKKNLFLMTGSFALTIVLFLAFSACLDVVHKLLPSVSDFTSDITIASQDETNSIDKNLSEEISEISGVESAFGMMLNIGIVRSTALTGYSGLQHMVSFLCVIAVRAPAKRMRNMAITDTINDL